MNPDGVFLSNGPGDPAATGEYAVPEIQELVARASPCSASASATRCLGLALGARTVKMHQGHHGANHPVQDFTTGKVEITTMNYGFAVDRESLLANGVTETHVSLFDGSNCGLALDGKSRCSRRSITPRHRRGPRTATICSRGSPDLMRDHRKS